MRRLLVSAVVSAFAIGVLSGCTPSVDKAQSQSSSSPQSTPTQAGANPNSGETWYKDEMSAVDLGPMPSELKAYKEMPVDQFATLPKAEQWKYVSWLTKNRSAFMDVFYKDSGSVESAKPVTLTAESGASDVFGFFSTSFRQAMATVDGTPSPQPNGPSGALDKDAVAKITLAMETDKANADEQAAGIIKSAGDRAPSVGMLGVGGAFDMSKIKIDNDTVTDATYEGIAAKQHAISYTDSAGNKRTLTAYVYPITTFDGKQLYVTSITPNGLAW